MYQAIITIVNALNNKVEENSEWNKQRENEYHLWLSTEEPKYRLLHAYPPEPDWHFRKIYAQRACNYTCQSCGKTRYSDKSKEKARRTQWHTFWTGLHVHHIIPLSKGGDNSLSNLTCLCETCHENQHKHMLVKKLNFYKDKLKRSRSDQMKSHWNSEVQAIRQRLNNQHSSIKEANKVEKSLKESVPELKEQANSSEAMPQETALEKYTRAFSKNPELLKVIHRPGVVTQIVGYPKPKPQEMNLSLDPQEQAQMDQQIEQLRDKRRKQGIYQDNQDPEGTMRVIFRPKMPEQKHSDSDSGKFENAEKKIAKKTRNLKRFFDNVFHTKSYQVSLRPKNEKG